MKSLIFDAGPVISLATNNLLWILKPLKDKFGGKFYITDKVKHELVDVPLETKKFKFEALQVQKLIDDRVIEILENEFIKNETPRILRLANEVFRAYGNYIRIVHFAEMSVLAACISTNAEAVVIDEKTTRFLVENPRMVVEILRKNLHTSVYINENNLKEFRNFVKKVKLIRSVELAVVAYELGLLKDYVVNVPQARRNLLEGILWGVKLNGCAVSTDEIQNILKVELS